MPVRTNGASIDASSPFPEQDPSITPFEKKIGKCILINGIMKISEAQAKFPTFGLADNFVTAVLKDIDSLFRTYADNAVDYTGNALVMHW